MWDKRYKEPTYAYGTEPNVFFKKMLKKYDIKGKLLLPAEGEGRNAIYAAQQSWNVYAFDKSIEGQKKAMQLAQEQNVSINYQVGDFFDLPLVNEAFDAAALIYAHFPPNILESYYRKIGELICSGGMLFLEGFSTTHLKYRAANPKVGGPNALAMLFSTQQIKDYFPDFEIIQLEDVEVELHEGLYHNGKGKVIRFIGRKK